MYMILVRYKFDIASVHPNKEVGIVHLIPAYHKQCSDGAFIVYPHIDYRLVSLLPTYEM